MEKKLLTCKRLDTKGLTAFWKEINQAYADGWKFDENYMNIREVPRVHGVVRVTLMKEEVVIEDPIEDEESTVDENINTEIEAKEEIEDGSTPTEESNSEKEEEKDAQEEVLNKEVLDQELISGGASGGGMTSVEEQSAPLFDDVDKLTKKKELLEYAESFGIEIPEKMKQPAAIKKHIKAQLSD